MWLTHQARRAVVNLDVSSLFKRSEGDRGSALRFFFTITQHLVLKMFGLDRLVIEVVGSDPTILDKALVEQFDNSIPPAIMKSKTDCP